MVLVPVLPAPVGFVDGGGESRRNENLTDDKEGCELDFVRVASVLGVAASMDEEVESTATTWCEASAFT